MRPTYSESRTSGSSSSSQADSESASGSTNEPLICVYEYGRLAIMDHAVREGVRAKQKRCQKHAFARISENVDTDRRSPRPSSSSTPVRYGSERKRAMRCGINRYYDPATGQFLSVDPLVGVTGAAYSYVGGDPVNGTDPLGLFSINPLQWLLDALNNISGHRTIPWVAG